MVIKKFKKTEKIYRIIFLKIIPTSVSIYFRKENGNVRILDNELEKLVKALDIRFRIETEVSSIMTA